MLFKYVARRHGVELYNNGKKRAGNGTTVWRITADHATCNMQQWHVKYGYTTAGLGELPHHWQQQQHEPQAVRNHLMHATTEARDPTRQLLAYDDDTLWPMA